jgi:hypothetical protein
MVMYLNPATSGTAVKVLTLPSNPDVKTADITLLVGRNASRPARFRVRDSREFYIKLHEQSANPTSLDRKPHLMSKSSRHHAAIDRVLIAMYGTVACLG